jgi:succinate dehydrogenase/fumarate reductase flavoprotein subunit
MTAAPPSAPWALRDREELQPAGFVLNVIVINVTGEVTMGDRITTGNITNSIVNLKSVLHSVAQNIGVAPLESRAKAEISEALAEISRILEREAKEKPSETAAIGEEMKTVSERVATPTPNVSAIRRALSSLREAAVDLAETIPAVAKLTAALARAFGFDDTPPSA